MSSIPPAPVQGYVDASNAFDGDPLTGWFPGDSLVNDTRQFCDKEAIRACLDREIIGDKVTTGPTATAGHYGEAIIVRAAADGEYDKTRLPDPLVLACYFTVHDDPHRSADHHPQPANASAGEALREMPGRKEWPCR
jgi:hypothetical protein